jgi:hypothetical protein
VVGLCLSFGEEERPLIKRKIISPPFSYLINLMRSYHITWKTSVKLKNYCVSTGYMPPLIAEVKCTNFGGQGGCESE